MDAADVIVEPAEDVSTAGPALAASPAPTAKPAAATPVAAADTAIPPPRGSPYADRWSTKATAAGRQSKTRRERENVNPQAAAASAAATASSTAATETSRKGTSEKARAKRHEEKSERLRSRSNCIPLIKLYKPHLHPTSRLRQYIAGDASHTPRGDLVVTSLSAATRRLVARPPARPEAAQSNGYIERPGMRAATLEQVKDDELEGLVDREIGALRRQFADGGCLLEQVGGPGREERRAAREREQTDREPGRASLAAQRLHANQHKSVRKPRDTTSAHELMEVSTCLFNGCCLCLLNGCLQLAQRLPVLGQRLAVLTHSRGTGREGGGVPDAEEGGRKGAARGAAGS